jgi:hypothetical protein
MSMKESDFMCDLDLDLYLDDSIARGVAEDAGAEAEEVFDEMTSMLEMCLERGTLSWESVLSFAESKVTPRPQTLAEVIGITARLAQGLTLAEADSCPAVEAATICAFAELRTALATVKDR